MHAITSRLNPSSPVLICAWFCGLSLVLTLHNKYVLDDVFRSSNGLLVAQCVFTIAVLLAGRHFRWICDFAVNPAHATGQEWFCAVCAAINVVAGLGALSYVSVVVHGVLKRLTCVASWLIELFFERKDSTWNVVPALAVLIGGSVLAGANDLAFSWAGYTLAVVSCFAQGGMFELGRRLVIGRDEANRNASAANQTSGYAAVLYLNSIATLAVAAAMFVVVPSAATGKAPGTEFRLMPQGATVACAHLFVNGVLALLMNHAIFLNCAVNSALAHAVTGNVKAALQTLFGAVMFATELTTLGWGGVFCNIAGAGLFSWIRSKKSTSGGGAGAASSSSSSAPVV